MRNLFTTMRSYLGEGYYFLEDFALDEGDGTDVDYWDVYLIKRIGERQNVLGKGVAEERMARAEYWP